MLIQIQTTDGTRLALHEHRAGAVARATILVVHGSCSNASSFRRFVPLMLSAGFDVYALDLRGHGASQHVARATFGDFAHQDVAAATREIRRLRRTAAFFLMGHSAGALACWMRLAIDPELRADVAGVVSLGAQATGDGSFLSWLGGTVLDAGLALLRRFPGRRLGVGPEDESAEAIRGWVRWIRKRRWEERGVDYLEALGAVENPALVIAGPHDAIAPVAGCRFLFDALASPQKRFVVCSVENGFPEDASHAALVCGARTVGAVWDLVEDWLEHEVGVRPAVLHPGSDAGTDIVSGA